MQGGLHSVGADFENSSETILASAEGHAKQIARGVTDHRRVRGVAIRPVVLEAVDNGFGSAMGYAKYCSFAVLPPSDGRSIQIALRIEGQSRRRIDGIRLGG